MFLHSPHNIIMATGMGFDDRMHEDSPPADGSLVANALVERLPDEALYLAKVALAL
jgi:hypothetical protein